MDFKIGYVFFLFFVEKMDCSIILFVVVCIFCSFFFSVDAIIGPLYIYLSIQLCTNVLFEHIILTLPYLAVFFLVYT